VLESTPLGRHGQIDMWTADGGKMTPATAPPAQRKWRTALPLISRSVFLSTLYTSRNSCGGGVLGIRREPRRCRTRPLIIRRNPKPLELPTTTVTTGYRIIRYCSASKVLQSLPMWYSGVNGVSRTRPAVEQGSLVCNQVRTLHPLYHVCVDLSQVASHPCTSLWTMLDCM
jgi:hypothetical protein